MNQLSIFEWDQFSAFGFFNINLRLIMSVSIFGFIMVLEQEII